MEYTVYDAGKDLLTMEALYQIVARLALEHHVLITREQFCRQTFSVVTTVDGLLAIVKRGLQLNLLMTAPPHSNGRAARG